MVGLTNFPDALDSHTSGSPKGFALAVNLLSTQLTAGINSVVTTIPVVSTTSFPSVGSIVIDDGGNTVEVIFYTGKTSTSFTGATRGADGTTASSHLISADVAQVPIAANHNDLAAAIVALETKLGIGSSTPTARKILTGSATGSSGWADYNGGATIYVAASDASAASKALASYVCDGVADEVEIQAALVALPAQGGRVLLSEGIFTISAAFSTAAFGSVLEGQGSGGTVIRAVAGGGAPINTNLINLSHQRSIARNFRIDGTKVSNGALTGMGLIAVGADDVLVENIWAINSAGLGIAIAGVVSNVTVVNCIVDAAASALGGYLCRSSGAYPAKIINCVARGNTGAGFVNDVGTTHFIGCHAFGNTSFGYNLAANDIKVIGCSAIANSSHGFYVTGVRGVIDGGCSADSNSLSGFYVDSNAVFTTIRNCSAFLNAANNGAVNIEAADCLVENCNLYQNGWYGIRSVGARVMIVGNRLTDNGTAAAATYDGIISTGNDCFIAGNYVRKGVASANKHRYGIVISGSNSYLGLNDVYDSGVTGEILDSGTNTRRVQKIQLDYVAATDLLSATAIAATTWTDILANQTFRVDSATSVIRINVLGCMTIGNSGTANTNHAVRAVIDSAGTPINKPLGGAVQGATTGYCNPILGGPLELSGLTIGNHTIKLQVYSAVAATANLRASAAPNVEFLNIQVVEEQR